MISIEDIRAIGLVVTMPDFKATVNARNKRLS